jgi:AraC-like DNA-binding protein
MELVTADHGVYPGYRMPLWHNPREDFQPDRGAGERFRLILVEDGSGILRLGGWRGTFLAPVLFCLNEVDRPVLEQNHGLRAQALYFHPSVINNAFQFDTVRRDGTDLPQTDSQDLYWIQPFIQRQPGAFHPAGLGPLTAKRVGGLIRAITRELAAPDNAGWPCRCRSYFLELLFVAERAYAGAKEGEAESLEAVPDDMDAVILFLHANYHRKITLGELARTFHTNRTTLTAQFNRATGLPVMAYLTRLRMNVASLILRDTKLEIRQVMHRVGFRDGTHFGRTFRRCVGCSPSEYRNRNNWMIRDDRRTPAN